LTWYKSKFEAAIEGADIEEQQGKRIDDIWNLFLSSI